MQYFKNVSKKVGWPFHHVLPDSCDFTLSLHSLSHAFDLRWFFWISVTWGDVWPNKFGKCYEHPYATKEGSSSLSASCIFSMLFGIVRHNTFHNTSEQWITFHVGAMYPGRSIRLRNCGWSAVENGRLHRTNNSANVDRFVEWWLLSSQHFLILWLFCVLRPATVYLLVDSLQFVGSSTVIHLRWCVLSLWTLLACWWPHLQHWAISFPATSTLRKIFLYCVLEFNHLCAYMVIFSAVLSFFCFEMKVYIMYFQAKGPHIQYWKPNVTVTKVSVIVYTENVYKKITTCIFIAGWNGW